MRAVGESILRYQIRLKLSIPSLAYMTRDRFAWVAIHTFRTNVGLLRYIDCVRWRPDGMRATRAAPYTRSESRVERDAL